MGDARKNEERRGQMWLIWLTLSERYESRSVLLSRQLEDHASMDRNNNAIDAIGAGEDFQRPDDDADAQQWTRELNARLRDTARSPVELTIDNITAVLDGVDSLLKKKSMPSDLGYRLRHALARFASAKRGDETTGEVERAPSGVVVKLTDAMA